MKIWELEDKIKKQTDNKRKTVDLRDLRSYVLMRLNWLNREANKSRVSEDGYGFSFGHYFSNGQELTYLDGYNAALEDMLHVLNAYHGYQSRDWDAFCSCEKWYPIVKRLQDIDSTTGTKHYWRLLDRLDRKPTKERKYYQDRYTDSENLREFRVTDEERKRAQRIADHYAYVLNL